MHQIEEWVNDISEQYKGRDIRVPTLMADYDRLKARHTLRAVFTGACPYYREYGPLAQLCTELKHV